MVFKKISATLMGEGVQVREGGMEAKERENEGRKGRGGEGVEEAERAKQDLQQI